MLLIAAEDAAANPFISQTEIWPYAGVFLKLVLAVAIGTFVGLERELSGKVGIRMFSLAAILGCMGGLLGGVFGPVAMVFVALFIGLMNWQEVLKNQRPPLTTSAALAVVGMAGVMIGLGHVFTPVAASIITAGLLALKERISVFAGALSYGEIRSAILLAILACIIYPVLPEHPVDPWGLIDPRENWIAVIAIAAIGFVNYIMLRILGPRGMELTAFFGGLVNSRKVIVELMSRARDVGDALTSSVKKGVILAMGSMVLRNALIVAIFSPRAIPLCAAAFLFMLISSTVLWWRAAVRTESGPPPAITLKSPFKLTAALKFGLLFLALNVAGALAERNFGAASFYFVTILGGLLSSASSITSAATLTGSGKIPVDTGANGIVLSTITSVLTNIPLILATTSDKGMRRQAIWWLGILAVSGLIGVAVTHLAAFWVRDWIERLS